EDVVLGLGGSGFGGVQRRVGLPALEPFGFHRLGIVALVAGSLVLLHFLRHKDNFRVNNYFTTERNIGYSARSSRAATRPLARSRRAFSVPRHFSDHRPAGRSASQQ